MRQRAYCFHGSASLSDEMTFHEELQRREDAREAAAMKACRCEERPCWDARARGICKLDMPRKDGGR